MVLIYDEKQKEAIMKWRNSNKEQFKEYQKEYYKSYYLKNKDKLLANMKRNKELKKSETSDSEKIEPDI